MQVNGQGLQVLITNYSSQLRPRLRHRVSNERQASRGEQQVCGSRFWVCSRQEESIRAKGAWMIA